MWPKHWLLQSKSLWVTEVIWLLVFGLAMTFSTGIKGVFDYSVFTASAAAFALSAMKEKFFELDNAY